MKNSDQLKTYETRNGNLSALIKVAGKYMRIRFISKDNISGYYATADPEVQQGIESDSGFEKKFWLCEEFVSTPVVEEIETTRYSEVTTWQGAREILRSEPYHITSAELSTPAKIRSVAKKLSVAFPAIANF